MHRFFADERGIADGIAYLNAEDAGHALRVLRLEVGDEVELVCAPSRYLAQIDAAENGEVRLRVTEKLRDTEAATRITLYQGLPKADKMEWIIQKSTELGAAAVAPVAMSRCVVKLEGKDAAKKTERWQKIAASAAEQSGRGRIPQVRAVRSFREAVLEAAERELALFPYENEKTQSLRACLSAGGYQSVSIMTGPEGGFSEDEVAFAGQNGMKICSLGPRILRCETAPLCALTAVLYAAGALD